MDKVILSPEQKALNINLNDHIYGTFSEIGAGQEVVRSFFRSGGASGTIAKAMSAYDMDVSDAIYGKEESGRYVCESRLKKMLNREYQLLEERLSRKKHPTKTFFSFANTIATTKYNNKTPGHGWMGIKFQTNAKEKASEIIIHLRLHDREAQMNDYFTCFFFCISLEFNTHPSMSRCFVIILGCSNCISERKKCFCRMFFPA
jgi:aryl-alcohol dehydrogenase-like predicted oxidoreductase